MAASQTLDPTSSQPLPLPAPTVSMNPLPESEQLMFSHARLDRAGFFGALHSATELDLSTSLFSKLVYRKYAENHKEDKGVTLDSFQLAIDHADIVGQVYEKAVSGLDDKEVGVGVEQFGRLLLDLFVQMQKMGTISNESLSQSILTVIQGMVGSQKAVQEIFDRWDTDGSGSIGKPESVVLGMVVLYITEAYLVNGEGKPLSRDNFGQALAFLGFGDTAKLWDGIFSHSMFTSLDLSGDGQIDLPEFWAGVSRLLRPVNWEKQVATMSGWPGWQHLPPEEISKQVASLKTGDLVLVQYRDHVAQFVQFSSNSPYSHIGVVVKHAARPGIANVHTEEILSKFPAKRKTHHSCSPGYCRCFDHSWDTQFKQSKIDGCGVSLLESTVEGIHVYDFAHRMFESQWAAKNIAMASIRRLSDVQNRDSYSQVESFISQVRGRLFGTDNSDFKGALERTASKEGLDTGGAFCSQVVTAFYKHMGWMEPDTSTLYMPCDFDDPEAPTFSARTRPVQVKGALGPPEIIHCGAAPKAAKK